jgi:hypothetical protein
METKPKYKLSKNEKIRAGVICASMLGVGALIYKFGGDNEIAKSISLATAVCGPIIAYSDYTNQKIKKFAKFFSNNFR